MDNIGISIEGLGRSADATLGSQGTVWALTENAPTNTDPDGAGDYDWTWGLVDFVTPSESASVPETGDVQAGAFSAQLHASEEQVTKVLLARQSSPTTNTESSLSESASNTTLALPSAELYSTNDVIYIGSETLRIASDDGGGIYTVERGFWGSVQGRHAAGSGVYDRPPYYANRAVTLWTSDGKAMSRRARTYLQSVTGGRAGTVLQLDTEEAISALSKVKRMRAMPDLRRGDGVSLRAAQVRSDDYDTVYMSVDGTEFTSRTRKTFNASLSPNDVTPYFQIGGGIVSSAEYAIRHEADYGVPGLWDGNHVEFDFGDEGSVDGAVYELAVWNRSANSGFGIQAPYEVSDLEAVVDNPWHPVVIAGLLLCSTDSDRVRADRLDMIAGDVGMGVPWLFGDEGIQAFIDAGNSIDPVKIDQLVLGWDGEPEDVLSVAIRLMLSAGYYLASNQRGYLIPKKFDTLSVAAYVGALNNSIRVKWPRDGVPVWDWDPGFSEAITEKTGVIGKTPMYDGYSLSALSIGASARINTLSDPRSADYDFGFYRLERGIDYAQGFLQRQASIMRNNQPRVRFEAHDPVAAGTDYSVGEWAILDIQDDADPLIFDEDGTRRSNDDLDTQDLAVLITGRAPSGDFGSYTLTGRAVNYGQALGRFRAPSAVVDSWDEGTNTITVSATSDYSADQSDENAFTAGQQVQLYDETLSLRSTTVQTIQSVSTAQEIELVGGFGVTPAQGDILELATYDNYTHQDFGTLRGYCYLADASDTLGTANDDADEWQ